MRVLGVDLSEYQRGIDFDRLMAEGAEFVILRGGDGGYNDKCFAGFYDKAKARKLPVGAYWFSRALNANQAQQEAMQFYDSCLKGRQFELPVYMDIECKAQQNLSKAALTEVVKVWTSTLRKLGYLVGVYTTALWLTAEIDRQAIGEVELWIAQWSAKQPTIDHGMWQFGGDGYNYYRSKYMAGFVMDQNWMYKDYPSIVKTAGLNGYGKENIEMTKEEVIALIDQRIKAALEGENTKPSDWAKEEMAAAVAAGITDGSRPQGYARREEVAAMVLRSAT